MVRGACGYGGVPCDFDSRSKAGERGGVFDEREGSMFHTLPQTRIKKAVTERKNPLML